MVCPERETGPTFVLIAHRRINGRAERTGQLYGRGTDATAAAVDEERLTRFQAATVEYIAPHSEKGFRETGCLYVRQTGRYRQTGPCIGQRIFGITATSQQCTDPVTDF